MTYSVYSPDPCKLHFTYITFQKFRKLCRARYEKPLNSALYIRPKDTWKRIPPYKLSVTGPREKGTKTDSITRFFHNISLPNVFKI